MSLEQGRTSLVVLFATSAGWPSGAVEARHWLWAGQAQLRVVEPVGRRLLGAAVWA